MISNVALGTTELSRGLGENHLNVGLDAADESKLDIALVAYPLPYNPVGQFITRRAAFPSVPTGGQRTATPIFL